MKTIIFDLDGTLIQTPKIIMNAFEQTFKHYLPETNLNEKELSNFLGQTLWQTFEFYSKNEKQVDDMVKYYRKVSNELIELGLETYPGAKETLQYFKKKGCIVGIVTSKMKSVAENHLKLTQLFEYVDFVIGHEDVDNHKPHPDPLLKAMDLFGSKKGDTIYVGDHENDIKAAKNAGIESCAVTYSIRLKEMLLEQPEYVVNKLKDLKDLI